MADLDKRLTDGLLARAIPLDGLRQQEQAPTMHLRREIVGNFTLMWSPSVDEFAPDLGIVDSSDGQPVTPSALGFIEHDGFRRYYILAGPQVEWLRQTLNAAAREQVDEAVTDALDTAGPLLRAEVDDDDVLLLAEAVIGAICGPAEPDGVTPA